MKRHMKQLATLLLSVSMSLSMVMGNAMAMEEVTEEVAYEEVSEEYVEEIEAEEENLGEESLEEESTIIVDDFVYEEEGLAEENFEEEVVLEEMVEETEEMTEAAALEEGEPQMSGKCGDNVTYKLTQNEDSFKFYNWGEQKSDTCEDCYTLTISGSGDMWDFYNFDFEQEEWINLKERPWEDLGWQVTRIVVESGVTEIGEGAFVWFEHVNSVSLPSGLKSIGSFAFHRCVYGEGEDENWHATSGLKEITIPSSVTSIGENAFWGCDFLEKVNYAGDIADICPNGTYEDGNPWSRGERVWRAFSNTIFAENYGLTGQCGDNVTYQLTRNSDSFKFYNWGEQKNDICEDCYTLTISGSGAMWDFAYSWSDERENWITEKAIPWRDDFSWSVTRIVVEPGVTAIGDWAFAWCNHVNSVSLPSGLKNIGSMAFNSLVDGEGEGDNWHATSGLKEITIPSSVTSIEERAFEDCPLLEKVNYAGDIADICPNGTWEDGNPWSNRERVWRAFSNTPFAENYGLSGQCGDNVTYQLTRNSDSFKFFNNEEQKYDICEDCYTLTISGSGAMWNYAYSWNDDGEIKEKATPWDEFRWNITRIVVNSGVTEIGEFAFICSHHVNSVSLPNGLKKIGANAFQSSHDGEGEGDNWHPTAGLKEITIPSSVTSIDFGAFSDCGMLTKVNYSGDIANICPNGEDDGTPWTNKIRVMTAFWGSPFAANYGLTQNTITVKKAEVNYKANASKAQSFSLGASNTAKLPMKYTSSSASVKVDSTGKVTIAKNFAGTAKITITTERTDEFIEGTKVVTVNVAKLAQPMKVTASTTSVKLSAVKKKAQKVTLKVTKAQGKVTYTSSNKKYVTVSSKGAVTLKKGTPKGTYKITVKAAGKGIYDKGSKVISIKVK